MPIPESVTLTVSSPFCSPAEQVTDTSTSIAVAVCLISLTTISSIVTSRSGISTLSPALTLACADFPSIFMEETELGLCLIFQTNFDSTCLKEKFGGTIRGAKLKNCNR